MEKPITDINIHQTIAGPPYGSIAIILGYRDIDEDPIMAMALQDRVSYILKRASIDNVPSRVQSSHGNIVMEMYVDENVDREWAEQIAASISDYRFILFSSDFQSL